MMKIKKEYNFILNLIVISFVLLFVQILSVGINNALAEEKQYKKISKYPPGLVIRAQKALIKKGYKPGWVDGKYGFRTGNAVGKFQKNEKLKITGELDYDTIRRLFYKK